MPSRKKSSAAADDAIERWFLKVDSRCVGPISREELEHFLRPPRLCSVLEVKCGKSGTWVTIGRKDTLPQVVALTGAPECPPASVQSAPPHAAGVFWRDYVVPIAELAAEGVALALRHRIITSALAIWVIANLTTWIVLPDSRGREQEIVKVYQALSTRLLGGEGGAMSSSEWKSFAEESLASVKPIIAELERSADVNHPARQNLLYAGRDHLLQILQSPDPPDSDSNSLRLFERHLQSAQNLLADAK